MTSKEVILDAIRRNRPAPTDLPELHHAWTTYPDPRAKFIEVLESVGGTAIIARDQKDLNEQLQRLPHVAAAQTVASLVPGVGTPNVDWKAVHKPHDLAAVDVAILPGQFGVAENGAVWATDHNISYRVLYFLCQHLVLVVPADAIVNHMHAAYERIAVGSASRAGQIPLGSPAVSLVESPDLPTFTEPLFGVFISGPSKTADIEQTLVIGAHGPRSLTVVLVEGD